MTSLVEFEVIDQENVDVFLDRKHMPNVNAKILANGGFIDWQDQLLVSFEEFEQVYLKMKELQNVKQDQYYLQESETIVGNCMLFWRKDRKGYTTNLDEAHIFTREEAQAQHRCRETDIPWPKKLLDSMSERSVNIQRVRRDKLK